MSRRKPPPLTEQELAEQQERAAERARMVFAARRDPKVRAVRVACDRATFTPEYRLGRIAMGAG